MRKFHYPPLPSELISKLFLVGAIIWAIPLVHHFMQKVNEKTEESQEQEENPSETPIENE